MKGTLDWQEIVADATVGMMRHVKHAARNDKHKHGGAPDAPWDADIESACAEDFVAKMLGLRWHHGSDGATDVGPYQVRHTMLGDGRLILHPDDKDDEIFILVTGRAPTFEIVGWCKGGEGKQKDFWGDPTQMNRPAFFVPRSALHDIGQLPKP